MNHKCNLDKEFSKYKVDKPVELKYPRISLIDKDNILTDYFYRDLEMFRPDLDEEPDKLDK
ncbi:MAG: hypothetical protein SOZ32_07430 [Bacilli bacterium]|nr:hypothetical protein [Mollicutes bacterium]MDY3900014.1 hypothetical protein [Bacilli bacterium]